MIRTLCLAIAFLTSAAAIAGVALEPIAFTPARAPVSPAGKSAAIDLPANLHVKNTGGSDGLGLCVFTSVFHSALWQNVPEFDGFLEWMRRRPGGGYPQKLDKMIESFAREKGLAAPLYIQHTGGDESLLELALLTGRMPSVTYAGRDDFYRGRIAHMVNLAHLDATEAAIIDNNRPGIWVWMTRAEFLQRWRDMDGGWAVVLLAPPPPPAATTTAPRMFGQCPGPNCPECFWFGPYGSGEARYWILRQGGADLGKLTFAGWFPSAARAEAGPLDVHLCPKLPPAAYLAVKPLEDPPAVQEQAPAPIENYGIELGRLHQGKRYSISGFEVDRDAALAAMAALNNDSGRYHVSIVSDDDQARRAALQTIATDPTLAAFRDRVHVQGYRSTDWPVAVRSLKQGLTVQKPRAGGGAVVWQSTDFGVGMLAEGLKYTDPNYSPPKPMPTPAPAPGPSPAPPDATPATPAKMRLVFILLGLALVYFQFRTTGKQQ